MDPLPYAQLAQLKGRLDFDIEDDPLLRACAENALIDASNQARFYGQDWPVYAVPPLVKTIVLNACARYMKLIEGVTSSRAGDETLTWTDLREKTGTVFLDDSQQTQLKMLAGKTPVYHSVPVSAWGGPLHPRRGAWTDAQGVGYAPIEGRTKPFPLYADGDV